MRIGRRGLLAGGGLGLLCAAALGTGLLSFTPAMRRLLVQRVIYFYVPGIVFEGDDLEAVTEYIHRVQLTRRNGGMRRLIGYGMATPVIHTPALAGFAAPTPTMLEIDQEIINTFFLCTDFWEAPQVPGRRIRVVRPPDPYDAGCSNPFAVSAGVCPTCPHAM
jgi:hypothetical protein